MCRHVVDVRDLRVDRNKEILVARLRSVTGIIEKGRRAAPRFAICPNIRAGLEPDLDAIQQLKADLIRQASEQLRACVAGSVGSFIASPLVKQPFTLSMQATLGIERNLL